MLHSKASTTPRTEHKWLNPAAPVLDKRKARNQRIRLALGRYLEMESVKADDKVMARRILQSINRIEREKPDTTLVGMVRIGDKIQVYCFEPDIAPLGKTPNVILSRHAVIDTCASAEGCG